jgi:hypothetical protein
MGMRVGSSSNTWAAQASSNTAALQQRQQSSQALFTSLSAGDLAGAQSAFSNLTGAAPSGQAGTDKVPNPHSPISQIGAALQKGDLKSAQAIAVALQAKNGKHVHGGKTATATPAATPNNPLNSLTTLLTGSKNTAESALQTALAANTSAYPLPSNSSASSILGLGGKINTTA